MAEESKYDEMTKEQIETHVLEAHDVNLNTSTMTKDDMIAEAVRLDEEVTVDPPAEPLPDGASEEPSDEGEGEGDSDVPDEPVPTPEEIIGDLRRLANMSEDQQKKRQEEVDAAFEAFCGTDPSREQFVAVMKGLVITSGMLYSAMKAHH